jgi:hypothetical protein
MRAGHVSRPIGRGRPPASLTSAVGRPEPMTKTLYLVAVLILVNGCQIYTGNMSKVPKRWVTVLDADTGAPIEGVALAYCHTKKPYFIVSSVVESRTYVSGPGGRACVPRNELLRAAGRSGYVVDIFRHPYPAPKNADVYYVRTLESHKNLMTERLQKEGSR